MPVCEADPWRMQYFENVACPENVRIPTEDGDSYLWYPEHRWVYNKLLIAESQGLACAPHGIDPTEFPVFSKPIFNMRGMGAGSKKIRSLRDYKRAQKPGHMWCELLAGEHISTDIAVVQGDLRWCRHTCGEALKGGMFDHWIVEKDPRSELESYTSNWIKRNLPAYTGMLNIETIGGRIIEVHLRFADQWPDLYGPHWAEYLVELYAHGTWDHPTTDRSTGYSVVLFGAHNIQYRHPPEDLVGEILSMPEVSSVQITFHEDKDPVLHSMPPGGFRLAIVNGYDLEVQRKARERLAVSFWSTQELQERRAKGSAA